jgi:hypothetical protein
VKIVKTELDSPQVSKYWVECPDATSHERISAEAPGFTVKELYGDDPNYKNMFMYEKRVERDPSHQNLY